MMTSEGCSCRASANMSWLAVICEALAEAEAAFNADERGLRPACRVACKRGSVEALDAAQQWPRSDCPADVNVSSCMAIGQIRCHYEQELQLSC